MATTTRALSALTGADATTIGTLATGNGAAKNDLSNVTLGKPTKIYVDSTGGYIERNALTTIRRDVTNPASIVPNFHSLVTGEGDNATFVGVSAAYFEAVDRSGLVSSARGVLYGLQVAVQCNFERNNVPYDDVACIVVQNNGTARGTEAVYLGHNAALTSGDFINAIGIDMWATNAISMTGHYTYGIDAWWGGISAFSGAVIRVPNNVVALTARNAADSADVTMLKLNSSDRGELMGAEIIPWTSYTPSIAAGSGTLTSANAVAGTSRYCKINGTIHFKTTIQVVTKGTGATSLVVGLPVASKAAAGAVSITGYNTATAQAMTGQIAAGGSTVAMTRYDASDPLADGTYYIINGWYEV